MRKEKTLFILGIWVSVLHFLGFPSSIRKILFLITGFAIMYLAYLFYLEVKDKTVNHPDNGKTFIDNVSHNL